MRCSAIHDSKARRALQALVKRLGFAPVRATMTGSLHERYEDGSIPPEGRTVLYALLAGTREHPPWEMGDRLERAYGVRMVDWSNSPDGDNRHGREIV